MRETPFSVSLEQADSLKELSLLAQEMSELTLRALKTDKRSLRSDLDKAKFKAKLEMYCRFYKQTRDRYLQIAKRDGKSNTYKEPISFDQLVRDFNWQKTVTYSKPVLRNDEEEDHIAGVIPDFDEDEIIIKTEINMSAIFNRNNEEVIENAKSMTEKEFLEAYGHTTATEATLKKAYTELRTKAGIKDRVGEESSDEILEPKAAATKAPAKKKHKVGDSISFKFAGSTETGEIKEVFEDKYAVETKDGTKHTVDFDKVLEEEKKATAKAETTTTKTTTAAPANDSNLPSFKALEKDVKIAKIQELYDKGHKTTSAVKTELAKEYHIGHYDDVYNVFIKIKKE